MAVKNRNPTSNKKNIDKLANTFLLLYKLRNVKASISNMISKKINVYKLNTNHAPRFVIHAKL